MFGNTSNTFHTKNLSWLHGQLESVDVFSQEELLESVILHPELRVLRMVLP